MTFACSHFVSLLKPLTLEYVTICDSPNFIILVTELMKWVYRLGFTTPSLRSLPCRSVGELRGWPESWNVCHVFKTCELGSRRQQLWSVMGWRSHNLLNPLSEGPPDWRVALSSHWHWLVICGIFGKTKRGLIAVVTVLESHGGRLGHIDPSGSLPRIVWQSYSFPYIMR